MRTLAELGLALAISGCSAISVQTDHDPDFDFSGLNSFRWITAPGEGGSTNDRYIRGAIGSALEEKGFVETTERAALAVTFGVTRQRDQSGTPSNEMGRSGWGRGWDGVGMSTGGNAPNTWEDGTLVVDIYDTGTKDLVWTGSATTELSGLRSREDREAAVDEAVAKMMKDFPPGH